MCAYMYRLAELVVALSVERQRGKNRELERGRGREGEREGERELETLSHRVVVCASKVLSNRFSMNPCLLLVRLQVLEL